MATTIIVLFNLKNGAHIHEYEAWARNSDLPTVRGLRSIAAFDVYKMTGLLMGQGTPPYQYCEVIQVKSMDDFGKDIASDAIQKIASQFQGFADNPIFITTQSLG